MTFRAASSGEFNASTGTITMPAGTLGGDVLTLIIARSANEGTPTAGSGWARIGSITSATSLTLYVYQKKAGGTVGQPTTETSLTTYTSVTSGRNVWIVRADYDIDISQSTFHDVPMVSTGFTTPSTSHTVPISSAVVTDGSFAIEIVVTKQANIETNFTAPAGVTRDAQKMSVAASSPHMATGSVDTVALAGQTKGGHTWTTVQSGQYITAVVILRAAAASVQGAFLAYM